MVKKFATKAKMASAIVTLLVLGVGTASAFSALTPANQSSLKNNQQKLLSTLQTQESGKGKNNSGRERCYATSPKTCPPSGNGGGGGSVITNPSTPERCYATSPKTCPPSSNGSEGGVITNPNTNSAEPCYATYPKTCPPADGGSGGVKEDDGVITNPDTSSSVPCYATYPATCPGSGGGGSGSGVITNPAAPNSAPNKS